MNNTVQKPEQATRYPLSIMQEAIAVQEKFSLHKGMMQIPIVLYFNRPLDRDLLLKAINIEFQRNDCLRTVFIKEKKEIFQYFKESGSYDNLALVDFTGKTASEQKEYITKTAKIPLKYFDDEPIKFVLIKTFDGKTALLTVCNHLNMDAWGVFITISDLFAVYNSLEKGADVAPMPAPLASSEACLKNDLAYTPEMMEADRKALIEYYSKDGNRVGYSHTINFNRPLPAALKKRALNKKANKKLASLGSLFHDKSGNVSLNVSCDMMKKIINFCETESIPFNSLFAFALRTYLSKTTGSDTVLYSTLVNRRGTLAEKRSGGCRVGSAYLRTTVPENCNLKESIAIIDEAQRKLYRHLRLGPYWEAIVLSDHFGACQFVEGGSLMFTLMPLDLPMPEGFKCDIEFVSLGYTTSAVYLFTIPRLDDSLTFNYDYRAYMTCEEQVRAMHENLLKIFSLCMENPDIKVSDILKQLN